MSMGRRPRDLSGQKFGLLTAMYPTEHRDHRGSVLWHCVCECGNEINVSAGALLDGNNRSCGLNIWKMFLLSIKLHTIKAASVI